MRQRSFSPRKGKFEVPTGWTHAEKPAGVSKNDTHSYYRCGEIARVVCPQGMELRRCTHVCRKEYIHYHTKSDKHVYNLEQKLDPGFPHRAVQQEQARIYERLRSAIAEKLAVLIVRTGISVNRASQAAMQEFIHQMLELGMSFAGKNLRLDDAITDFSRRTLTEHVLRFGAEMKERDVTFASEAHFVNLVVDAGTVLGRGVIHALLNNPYHPGLPVILELIEGGGYDKWKYKQLFSILIYKCINHGLIVCSIVTDGLRAQRAALLELVKEAEDKNIRAIYPVYCHAHLTQLVFTDAVKKCPYMKGLLTQVNSLAVLLRTSVVCRELGEKCPSLCPTRWLYVVDVLLWLYKRKTKINAFLLASENNSSGLNALPDDWRRLLMILLPLKRLSLAMEASDCGLWEVIPIVERVMSMWKLITSSLVGPDLELLVTIITRLITRLSLACPTVAAAAYSLSEMGRSVLRQRERGLQTRGPDEENVYVTERIMRLDKWCSGGVAEFLDEEETRNGDDQSSGNVDDENTVSAEDQATNSEDEQNDEVEEDTPDELLSLSLEELLQVDVYQYDFSVAFTEIKRLGEILEIDERYLYERYRTWVFERRSDTPTCHEIGQCPDHIWRRVPAVDNGWRDFSQIALRLVTITTSEADCERSLSRQRDVQGIRTSVISTDLLEARMRR